MKSKEEQIKELNELIRDYETIIKIHTKEKTLYERKDYGDYIDTILDEINEVKKKIKNLENE